MTINTTRLGLKLYDSIADSNQLFSTFVSDIAGSANSNMTKIDTWSGWVSGSISNLINNISGSTTTLNNTINGYFNSLNNVSGSITTITNRFSMITSLSGSGMLDFNVPQTFNNLLIIGIGKSNYSGTSMNIGVEFNMDNNPSNYISVNWIRILPSVVWLTIFNSWGMIETGNMSGNQYLDEYPSPFMIYIPNYRDTNSYKTSIGISIRYSNGVQRMTVSGGTWNNTSSITRIRVNPNLDRTFTTGTKLSVYGLG